MRASRLIAAGILGRGFGPPSIAFPSNLARYDLNFVTQTYFGGIQPLTPNNDDGRFFRQQIAQNVPMLSENADGSLLSQNYQGLRIGTRGMWVESQLGGANPVLWNRDLTNAAWVKTNCTVLKNLTGRDGTTNAASRVTATADGATVLQTLVAASSSRNFAFDIAIISGSGIVQYSIDGAAYTNIPTPVFKNGIWSRVFIPNQTIGLNAVVGFKLQTNGDVVGFDLIGQDTLTYDDSPLAQTSTALTRQRDRPSTAIIGEGTTAEAHGSGWLDYMAANADWGFYFEWQQFTLLDNAVFFGTNLQSPLGSTNTIRFSPGTGTLTPANLIQLYPATNKCIALTVGGQGLMCLNGGTVVTGACAGPYTTLTHADVMSNGAGALNPGGTVRRMSLLTQNLAAVTPAMAQAFTT